MKCYNYKRVKIWLVKFKKYKIQNKLYYEVIKMKMTFRWYGQDDPVTLSNIRQIPCMTGVVTAVYSVPVGEVWPMEEIEKLKTEVNKNGLEMEVIESVPVHEDIKLKRGNYQLYIDNYKENIRRLASVGVKCIC